MGQAAEARQTNENAVPMRILNAGLSDFTKYVAIAGFVLYLFGFLIWYAYLSQYGIAPPSLWKIEFFAASLCYFSITFATVFPAALIWSRIFAKLEHSSLDVLGASKIPLYPLLLITAFLCSQMNTLFFGTSMFASNWYFIFSALAIVHIGTSIVLRIRKKVYWFSSFIHSDAIHGAYFLLASLSPLASSERSDGFFLMFTVGLLFSATVINGLPLHIHWKSFSLHLKLLTCVGIAFLLLIHARTFGIRQFGKIAQSVGGGEPLRALLIMNPEQQSLAVLLGIPRFEITNASVATNASIAITNATVSTMTASNTATSGTNSAEPLKDGIRGQNITPTNSSKLSGPALFGPISLLMKSDREIVFLSPSSIATSNFLTLAKTLSADQVKGMQFLKSK